MTGYRRAGVDLAGAERHVQAIGSTVTATWGEDVIGKFGGFAAGIRIPAGYRDPILMLTTSTSPLLAVEAMRAGATDYLVKPVAPDRMMLALRNTTTLEAPRDDQKDVARVQSTRSAGS